MRKLCLVLITVIFTLPLIAQKKSVIKESKVPDPVMKSFSTKFPEAKTSVWKTKSGNYEVDFYLGMTKYEAKYQGDGTWIKTSWKSDKKDIPAEVLKAWKDSEFGKWMFEGTEKVETPDYKLLYLIKIIKGTTEMELLYTPVGELLKAKNKN